MSERLPQLVSITDPDSQDPEGQHVVKLVTVFNDRQRSTNKFALTDEELQDLFEAAGERLGWKCRHDTENS